MLTTPNSLSSLLAALDPDAPLAERHVWLIDWLQWLRGNSRSAPATVRASRRLAVTRTAPPTRATAATKSSA